MKNMLYAVLILQINNNSCVLDVLLHQRLVSKETSYKASAFVWTYNLICELLERMSLKKSLLRHLAEFYWTELSEVAALTTRSPQRKGLNS